MEKQDQLVDKTLRVLAQAGILDHVLIIGSWCAHFYKDYFSKIDYNPRIRTRDIDFLLSSRPTFKPATNLANILKSLGFETEFFGNGYMKLENVELSIEFLIPEVGPSRDKPYSVPSLKFNAQPLRHLSFLWNNPIECFVGKTRVYLPHPSDFSLQKLIVAHQRKKRDKAQKDRECAFEIIQALIASSETKRLIKSFVTLTKKEQKIVQSELEKSDLKNIITLFKESL